MHLLDINVWLGMAFKRHTNHVSASGWFHSIGPARCYFCRMVQAGFLRLASSRQAMGAAAVTLADAWRAYDLLFADPNVAYAEEPEGIEPLWRALTQHQTYSPKVWNDAYLAAFAEAANFEIVTFDQGFRRYTNVRCTILT